LGGNGGNQPDLSQLLGNLQGGNANLAGLLGGLNPSAGGDPNLPPAERFKDQLQQMKDMGFTNQDMNIEVLQQTGGNVNAAIERLLNMLG